MFTARTTKPEKGNPYYNTKSSGGYSDAIKGNPTDPDCNVLHNCVGYAFGRFNEIANAGKMLYLAPVNAEKFIDFRNYRTKGVEYGQFPKLGACMVWQAGATKNSSDGAGHVAIVERIYADGSILTSESGYKAKKPFWTQKRSKGSDGNWGQGKGYTFLGFIYNPAVTDEVPTINWSYLRKGDEIYTTKDYPVYMSESAALKAKDPVKVYPAGKYYVFKVSRNCVNISKNKLFAGGWIYP